jgi:hypothetical protein
LAQTDPYRELVEAERQFLVEELKRRIELIEHADDTTFGRFSAFDWFVCAMGSFILPAIVAFWAAP